MAFNLTPYTNFHEMNLDWILMKVKELDEKVNDELYQVIADYIDSHLSTFILKAAYSESSRTIFIRHSV